MSIRLANHTVSKVPDAKRLRHAMGLDARAMAIVDALRVCASRQAQLTSTHFRPLMLERDGPGQTPGALDAAAGGLPQTGAAR